MKQKFEYLSKNTSKRNLDKYKTNIFSCFLQDLLTKFFRNFHRSIKFGDLLTMIKLKYLFWFSLGLSIRVFHFSVSSRFCPLPTFSTFSTLSQLHHTFPHFLIHTYTFSYFLNFQHTWHTLTFSQTFSYFIILSNTVLCFPILSQLLAHFLNFQHTFSIVSTLSQLLANFLNFQLTLAHFLNLQHTFSQHTFPTFSILSQHLAPYVNFSIL